MNDTALLALRWLLHVAGGGGSVLLLACAVVSRLRQPARRQRVAEWGVVAALLLAGLCLGPSWLLISLPTSDSQPVVAVQPPAQDTLPPHPAMDLEQALAALPDVNELPADPIAERPFAANPKSEIRNPKSERSAVVSDSDFGFRISDLVIAYFVVAVYFLARLAWGYWKLSRFLATARPVPGHVWRLFEEMTPYRRRPRLLAASGVRVPLSCGVFRPTIVLPDLICAAGDEAMLRWVLAHELSHLRRRDALTSLLFGLGRAVYFFVPWFWWLRKQVRLCQEYVADAAAVAETGPVEGYAEFLLHWSAAPAVPAGAAGVSGQSSDLFRRITMLIRSPFTLEQRCPRRWSLLAAGVLLSLAVLTAGIGLSQAARADSKDEPKKKDVTKDEPKKEDPKKKEEPKPEKADPLPGFPDVEDLLKQLPGGLDDNTAKMLRQQLELTRKMLQQMRKQGAGGAMQLPGIGGGVIPLPGIGGGGLFPNFQIRPRAGRNSAIQGMTEPRLGVRLDKPSATIVDQLDLPRDQGMIVEDVRDDSAAAKVGLKQHDILLELAGKPVPSDPQGLNKLLQSIKPDEAVEAVVMRKSKKETIKNLKLPKMPEQPGRNNPFRLNFEQPFGALNDAFNGNAGNGQNSSTSMTRTNDGFTIRHLDNGVMIGIKGTVNDGKAQATDVVIQEGEKAEKYTSVDKVPEAYREKVRDLLKQAATGKVVQFNLNK